MCLDLIDDFETDKGRGVAERFFLQTTGTDLKQSQMINWQFREGVVGGSNFCNDGLVVFVF